MTHIVKFVHSSLLYLKHSHLCSPENAEEGAKPHRSCYVNKVDMSHMHGLALMFLPIFKCTIFLKRRGMSIFRVVHDLGSCCLPAWIQVPLVDFTSTLNECVGGDRMSIVNNNYRFHSLPIVGLFTERNLLHNY